MTISPELLQLYHSSQYRMELPTQTCIVQIGALAPALDDYLRMQHCSQAVFVSAHNPRSHRLPAALNHTRHAALEQILIARRLRWLPGVGYATADMPSWPEEPGFLLLNISTDFGRSLGALFGQHAVLLMVPNQAAQLLLCQN